MDSSRWLELPHLQRLCILCRCLTMFGQRTANGMRRERLSGHCLASGVLLDSRFVTACVDLLKKNDITKIAQLKNVKYEDLSFAGSSVSAGRPRVHMHWPCLSFAPSRQESSAEGYAVALRSNAGKQRSEGDSCTGGHRYTVGPQSSSCCQLCWQVWKALCRARWSVFWGNQKKSFQ